MYSIPISVKLIKNGDWILYDTHQWLVVTSKETPNHEYSDYLIVCIREDLEAKKLRIENGTWRKGRATITKYLYRLSNEFLMMCEEDKTQFTE